MSNDNNIQESSNRINCSKIRCYICGRKTLKIASSILVPLLIGIATVVISVVQLQIASKQRAQDLQIANERREQDLHVADNLQQDLVLAAYIEQMSELMLSPNFTVNDMIVANMCRAKTLIALRQLDSKRKTHLFKFLYEVDLIRHYQPHVNLADTELDNIDLSETNSVAQRYDSKFRELSLEQASLNNASFAYRKIVNSTFEKASLIGANFTGCRFSSISFVGSDLRYANFHNASSLEYINFKSADLFGSIISDEMLLGAISIEDAILPNGTRGIQRNLLMNGGAESPNCKTNRSIPSSWHVERISGDIFLSVDSYESNTNFISTKNSTISSGQCFYAAYGCKGKIRMYQEIPFTSFIHMPINHGNVAILLQLFCASVGNTDENQSFAELHVEQIDRNGISLQNYTRDFYVPGTYTKLIECHNQLHQIVYSLSFIKSSITSNVNNTDNNIFFYCDNIYLSMIPYRSAQDYA